jgi:hypothetical protein
MLRKFLPVTAGLFIWDVEAESTFLDSAVHRALA